MRAKGEEQEVNTALIPTLKITVLITLTQSQQSPDVLIFCSAGTNVPPD
jgi:hypothetical protein